MALSGRTWLWLSVSTVLVMINLVLLTNQSFSALKQKPLSLTKHPLNYFTRPQFDHIIDTMVVMSEYDWPTHSFTECSSFLKNKLDQYIVSRPITTDPCLTEKVTFRHICTNSYSALCSTPNLSTASSSRSGVKIWRMLLINWIISKKWNGTNCLSVSNHQSSSLYSGTKRQLPTGSLALGIRQCCVRPS